jgi:sterol 14-demethylase
VLAELDATFAGGEVVGFNSLRNIPLTERTVLEVLRLHPPLFMLVRVAKEDFVYKDYFVRKGSWVLVSPTVTHRIPELFHDPEAFDPDRFAPPRDEDKRDFAFVPFGGGRHKCMGNAFALLQIKAILAILLRRYDFELVNPRVESDFHGLVVGPKEPCRVRYRRRRATEAARPAKANGAPAPAPAQAKRYRVTVDLDLCQGHAACVGDAPEVFRVDGLGKVRLLDPTPEAALSSKVEEAAAHCPTGTIHIVEA